MMRAPQLFPIPAGTRASECSSCRQVVYWIVTGSGRRMPVAVEPRAGDALTGAYAPTVTADGKGYSHFIDCPHAQTHRKEGAA